MESAIREYIVLKECEGDTIHVYDIQLQGEEIWLILDIADGDLLHYIRNETMNKEWKYELLTSLASIHDRGICQLDVKPQNCLIKNNRLFISDLGTARFFTYSLPYNRIHIGTDYYRDIRLNKLLIQTAKSMKLRTETIMAFSNGSVEQHGEVDVYAAGITIFQMEPSILPTFVQYTLSEADNYVMVSTIIERYNSIDFSLIVDPDLRKLIRQITSENHETRITAKQCCM